MGNPEIIGLPGDQRASCTLVGVDGNVFVIMGTVINALREAGHGDDIISRYKSEAMSGDYDHAIAVSLAYTKMPDGPDMTEQCGCGENVDDDGYCPSCDPEYHND